MTISPITFGFAMETTPVQRARLWEESSAEPVRLLEGIEAIGRVLRRIAATFAAPAPLRRARA